MNNFLGMIKNFFVLFFKNTLKKLKKKFLIFILLLKYFVWYIIILVDDWFHSKFKDQSFSLEMKSLVLSTIFAFFFYYLIVVELSILVFGYSLLCYWFLFIFLFISLIISWRLEVQFIKYVLSNKDRAFVTNTQWLFYYDGETPYSFYDYLTNYKKKPLFKHVVLKSNMSEIEEGWYLQFTFFLLFLISFFYICSYRFTPTLVTFVAHYFYPVVNFFEIWSEPRLVDFYSALIWFWNWLVTYLEYKYEDQPFKLSLLEKIPRAPQKWESWGNRAWLHKISLRKTSDFGDIFFLWELRTQSAVHKLVFSLDQPTVTIDRAEVNTPLYFLWYIHGQYDLSKKNFWWTHFTEDNDFWDHVTFIWDQVNNKVFESDYWEPYCFFGWDLVIPNLNDTLLSQNYFDDMLPITHKKFFNYAAYWEFYRNLIDPKYKEYYEKFPTFELIFLRQPWVPRAQNFFWFRKFLKKSKNPDAKHIKKNFKKMNKEVMLNIYWDYGFTFKNLKNLIFSKPDELDLYNYFFIHEFESLELLEPEDLFNSTEEELNLFLKKLDWRLAVLEEKFSLNPMLFSQKDYKWITWRHLVTMLVWWIRRLDAMVNKRNIFFYFKNKIPSYYEVIDTLNNSYWPSRRMKKIYEKVKSSRIKIYIPPKEDVIWDIITLEKVMRDLEKRVNLRPMYSAHYDIENRYIYSQNKPIPWYAWSIKYFNSIEIKTPLPSFIWFIVPTPYAAPFSTFGLNWLKYQRYRLENASTIVSVSTSYAGDWSSTPTILYTGVEAIIYFWPILKVFEFISKIIINLVSYPIEFILTKIPWISEKLSVIIFLAHFNWFLHYYLYAFLFFYFFYYFAKFYYHRYTYMWIYEWMFETAFVNQNNGFVYWHTLNDIWKSYKNPHQFAILSLQTNMLLSYSFSNFINFIVTTRYGNIWLLTILGVFFSESKKIVDYFLHSNDYVVFQQNLLSSFNFKYFKYYFNVSCKKYNMLLYDGGSDCNLDSMLWGYFDYLSQVSIYLSRSLKKNFYLKKKDQWLVTLTKHLTILFSSSSVSPNFYFLSSPLQDSVLAWKLILELFRFLNFNPLIKDINIFTKYLYYNEDLENMFTINFFLNSWFNFFNFFCKNNSDLYKIFDLKELNFISKYNKKNFWDSEKYWIFAFFWSFWFISKLKYPYINLPKNYEINWLQLRWMAYTNSWIGSTINIWPFFNLIQHIWWTSWTYNRAFSITDNYLNLNISGVSSNDNVWNFLEKWYAPINNNKVETLFGAVWTLSFLVGKKNYQHGILFANSVFNFDLSYPFSTINRVTTNWMYPKTNPPINLLEIGITPSKLYYLFKYVSTLHPFIYLTFYEQMEYIDNAIFLNLKRELDKEYQTIPFFNINAKIWNPKWSSKFDFYLKKFDSLLKLKKNNELSNWIFSFDTSYFFNHFLTWDFLMENQEEIKIPKINDEIKKSKLFFILKNQSFSDINSKYTSADHWFKKPFGVLDKYELINMQKFKSSKNLDILSFTSNKENNFSSLEKEVLKKNSGLSYLDFDDNWTSEDAYNEKYLGERFNRFNFNNSTILNNISPLIIGWVGDIYYSNFDSTSILFSSLYSTDEPNPLAFQETSDKFFPLVTVNYWEFLIWSYFNNSKMKKRLYSRLFSWLNLILSPTAFRYFFGLKSISWLDYWSWKCGIYIDYWNGFYNYWPYLGYWHSFGAKLTSFDSMYGFYRSYWQIEDDPTIVDLETDAMYWIYEERDDPSLDDQYTIDYKEFYDIKNIEDRRILWDLSLRYREMYFSFHHPYFLGYFLFWFFTLLTKQQYLGLVNFSFKWLILWNFIIFNSSADKFNFNIFLESWNEFENKYWKNMYWYRLYFINPIKLTQKFTTLIDGETSLTRTKDDYLMATFASFYSVNRYFTEIMKFTLLDLNFLLDCKKIDLQLIKINWYNMDMPFPLNPSLIVNKWIFTSFEINYEKIYNSYFLSFSHYDSLRENVNLNMLFDEYLGTYIDSFNFISYYSTYRALSSLPEHFLDKPNYLATNNLWFWFDFSKQIAMELFDNIETYDNHDMITGYGLLMQNLAFLKFFSSTLTFIFLFKASFYDSVFLWNFLEFYFNKTDFGIEFAKLKQRSISPEDKKYSPLIHPINSYIAQYKHAFFLFQLCWNFPYDILTIWLDLGSIFFSKKSLEKIFNFWKVIITNRFLFLNWFYNWIGYQLYVFFFWK